MLSLGSAVLGIYFAQFLSRYLVDLLATGPLTVTFDLTATSHVLAFTVALSLATTVLFGLVPAWQATARRPVDALKTLSGIALRGRLLPSVVTAQVALCRVLVGAGLFIQTLRNLQALKTGFEHQGVLLIDVAGQRPRSFYKDALDIVRRLPGVMSASVSTNAPLSGAGWSETVTIDGVTQEREPSFLAVSAQDFQTLQTPILRGRDFAETDEGRLARIAIVNQTFSRRYFRKPDPIGSRFSASLATPSVDLEIVGIVSDVIGNNLERRHRPRCMCRIFRFKVMSQNFSSLQVRVDGPSESLANAIRRELQPRMPGTPVEIRSLTAQVDSASVRERLVTSLSAGLGVVALVLAAIGLYGLLAYSVATRTREIGIRVALGANPLGAIALVLRQGARLALVGIAIGIVAAEALSRFVDGNAVWADAAGSGDVHWCVGPARNHRASGIVHPSRRATRVIRSFGSEPSDVMWNRRRNQALDGLDEAIRDHIRARNRDQHCARNDTRRGASSGPACVWQCDPGPGKRSRRLDVDVVRAGASGSSLRRADPQELAGYQRDCGRVDRPGDRHQHHDLLDDQRAGDAAGARGHP